MSPLHSQIENQGLFDMEFGKRFSRHNGRPAPVILQTCTRCSGTGHVRERGGRIVCKACAGSGRTTVQAERRA
jgi:DnaJ-class molecular chaperone